MPLFAPPTIPSPKLVDLVVGDGRDEARDVSTDPNAVPLPPLCPLYAQAPLFCLTPSYCPASYVPQDTGPLLLLPAPVAQASLSGHIGMYPYMPLITLPL